MAENLGSILKNVQPLSTTAVKPTIVIVNVYYPPQAVGGATRVVHDNVRQLAEAYKDDFNVEVFATGWGANEDYEICSYVMDGVRVTSVLRAEAPDLESATVDLKMEDIFRNYLRRVGPALIHFHCIQRLTVSMVSAAIERQIPYVIAAHDGWWISDRQFIVDESDKGQLYDYSDPLTTARDWGASTYSRLMKLKPALFGARNVLAVSEKFADLYRRCGVPNVITVANGISDLKPAKRTRSTDGRVRLGYLGGSSHIKGYELIRYALLSRPFQHLRLTITDGGVQSGKARCELWNTTPVTFVPKVP